MLPHLPTTSAGGVPTAPPSTPSSSLFLEPMTWMGATIVGEVQGKLYCPGPGCNARLGSFDWSGWCRVPIGRSYVGGGLFSLSAMRHCEYVVQSLGADSDPSV